MTELKKKKEWPIALTIMTIMDKSNRTEAKKQQSCTSGATGRRGQQAQVALSSGLALNTDMT